MSNDEILDAHTRALAQLVDAYDDLVSQAFGIYISVHDDEICYNEAFCKVEVYNNGDAKLWCPDDFDDDYSIIAKEWHFPARLLGASDEEKLTWISKQRDKVRARKAKEMEQFERQEYERYLQLKRKYEPSEPEIQSNDQD